MVYRLWMWWLVLLAQGILWCIAYNIRRLVIQYLLNGVMHSMCWRRLVLLTQGINGVTHNALPFKYLLKHIYDIYRSFIQWHIMSVWTEVFGICTHLFQHNEKSTGLTWNCITMTIWFYLGRLYKAVTRKLESTYMHLLCYCAVYVTIVGKTLFWELVKKSKFLGWNDMSLSSDIMTPTSHLCTVSFKSNDTFL